MVDETKQETTPQPQEMDMVTRAEQAVAKLDAKLAETKALIEKNQAIEARMILGGKSNNEQQAPPPVETSAEYMKKVMSGKMQ